VAHPCEAILHDVRRFNEFRAHLGIARETLRARLDQLVGGGTTSERRPAAWARGSFSEYLLTECGSGLIHCLATGDAFGDVAGIRVIARRSRPRDISTAAGASMRSSAVRHATDALELASWIARLAPGPQGVP